MHWVDLTFKILRTIKSLPPWPGARWNALLRLAARAAGVEPEAAFSALLPERWGVRPWLVGEDSRLRLFFQKDNFSLTRALLAKIFEGDLGEGEFTLGPGGTLALAGLAWPGPERRTDAWPDEPPSLAESDFQREMEALVQLGCPFHLIFTAPLRLARPAAAPGAGDFCGPDFFAWPPAISHLLARLRGLPEQPAADLASNYLRADNIDLRWQDMAYNPERRMKLGGLTGSLAVSGRLSAATARRLVLGQYLGLGKNSRFGFGFYCIPELAPYRLWPLFPAPRTTRQAA